MLARAWKKIRLILASDLAPSSKLTYALDMAGARWGVGRRRGFREYRLRGGMRLRIRKGTTDPSVFEEIFIEQIYARHARTIRRGAEPIVLIDLGANIGLSVIALARALQPAGIVAVEPDEANFAMLLENLRLAGLADRCTALRAFAGAERGFAELLDSGNGAWGMRIGAPADSGIPVLPLAEIVGRAGRDGCVLIKCDIEGAERQLFLRMREWEHLASFIILELHTEFLAVEEFRGCLESSGYRWKIHGEIPPDACLCVVGLERLERKAAPRRLSAGRS
jgi:FkbM family methyltransferase